MKIAARFGVTLGLLVTAMLILGAVALRGLGELHESSRGLARAVEEAILDSDTRADLLFFRGKLQVYALSDDPAVRRTLRTEIDETTVEIEADFAQLRRQYASRSDDFRLIAEQERGYRALLAILRSGQLDVTPGPRRDRLRSALVQRIGELSQRMIDAAVELAALDVARAGLAERRAEESYRTTRRLVLGTLVLLVLIGAAAALWLVRTILPRTRRYAAFARRVASGQLDSRVSVAGRDELAELGHALNTMVGEREQERLASERQDEFTSALQVADDEAEAHEILKRHLERTATGADVTVLNKNNSADRLEAKTHVAEESVLARALDGAGPRSCLAVRFARVHRTGGSGAAPLLECGVCGALAGSATCRPMLVSGEVIGSLLVTRDDELTGHEDHLVEESVRQAAPVLGNLRNLAVAESRAATDALTGLPNNRAVRETLRQMAAQAARSGSPLTVALLDLDHFKQVNDTYGHASGDDVLAAVGAALRATIRQSDFAGRMGGEEFVLLLPDTASEEARIALEKIRKAVCSINVVGVERAITVSVGLAALPEHAGEVDAVLRAADRALYAAKDQGRNRVVVAASQVPR